ncbi:M23 family metallopeptidase [Novosphingopyxis iocasae]|uniref:M23 family metallopeptidase n=1 Tax=Novosphingopyxis iocasae TaxID=2762729 RepID=UPI0016510769|nr:M23 family metallopeptidase [Novosphingopyxis iocasae]
MIRSATVFLASALLLSSCVPEGRPEMESARANAGPPVVVPTPRPSPSPTPAPPPAEPVRTGFWFEGPMQQGALLTGRVPSGTRMLTFEGEAVDIGEDGFFIIGLDRDSKAEVRLVATLNDGRTVERTLNVAPGDWKLEYINAPYRAGVSSEAFKARRGPELARIVAARDVDVVSDGWRQDFIWPVTGRQSGFFGSQRVYQGKPGSYHGGADIAVPTGTIFVAPADGVVTLAAKDDFTLEGKLIIIDHGMGLNSAFLHASEILVNEGDRVKQGQPIGKVGQSGRATGPHLHWGLKWKDARIDPLLVAGPPSG